MIDTRALRHLIAVASHNSVQAAANSLHLTQPALTKSISRLEASIGEKLFDRRGHKLELTEFGQRLVQRGKTVIRDLEAIEEDIALWKGIGTGEVEIGVDPGVELSLLPRVLKAFIPAHPGVEVKIRSGRTETLVPALLDGGLHFVVSDIETTEHHQGLSITPLPRQILAPAVRPGHPLAERAGVDAEDVSPYPFLGAFTAPRFERWRDARGLREKGKPYVTSLLCGNFEVLIRFCEDSDAIVFGPLETLRHYENMNRLKLMPWPLDCPEMEPCLIRSEGRPLSPAAELLAQLFLQATKAPV